ncbi:hypothetical protein, partial [Proteus mirabilis]|uniref:hypothetical protein n=1 Tax=Proteus mirabilis TaxID=584 RepID=UPI003314E8CD
SIPSEDRRAKKADRKEKIMLNLSLPCASLANISITKIPKTIKAIEAVNAQKIIFLNFEDSSIIVDTIINIGIILTSM